MTLIHCLGCQSFVNNVDLHVFLKKYMVSYIQGKGGVNFLQLHLNIDVCLAASNLISIKDEQVSFGNYMNHHASI